MKSTVYIYYFMMFLLMQLPGSDGDITSYGVKICFNMSQESFDTPFYVLSFVGGVWLSMATLEVTGSPGVIEIVDVSNVQITNCSFRYLKIVYE